MSDQTEVIKIRTPSDGPSIFNTSIRENLTQSLVKWMPCGHEINRMDSDVPCPYCRIAQLEAEVFDLASYLETLTTRCVEDTQRNGELEIEIAALREERDSALAVESQLREEREQAEMETAALREQVARMPVVVGYVSPSHMRRITQQVKSCKTGLFKHGVYLDPPQDPTQNKQEGER